MATRAQPKVMRAKRAPRPSAGTAHTDLTRGGVRSAHKYGYEWRSPAPLKARRTASHDLNAAWRSGAALSPAHKF